MSLSRQVQLLNLGSRVVAPIALILGLAFFWVGPSTPPGRPLISLVCFLFALVAAFLVFSFSYMEKIQKSRVHVR